MLTSVLEKKESQLVMYKSGRVNTEVDYLLVMKKDRKLLIDVKVIVV